MKNIIFFLIKNFFSKIFNILLGVFNYVIIYRCGNAIGDHMYMSSIIREIRLNKKKKILLFSNYYVLFQNNKRINYLFEFKINSYIWFFLSCLKGKNILEFNSINIEKMNNIYYLHYHKNHKISLAQAASEHFKMNIDYSNLKNEFFFSKNEIKEYKKKFSFEEKFSLIQSVTKNSFTKNKEWKIEGMQKIIDSFPEINWIQIGTLNEPRLKNCKHILNSNLREVAYLIHKCDFLVSYEGFFNHLASCFNKKTFLIHTGFLHADSIKYSNNILIDVNHKMNCYPCFKMNCKDHKKKFLKNLKDAKVIEIIRNNIA